MSYALIRLENLRALGLTAGELSQRVGGRVSYWSDMLRGEKSFGERTARKVEDKLSLTSGQMDMPASTKTIPPTKSERATTMPQSNMTTPGESSECSRMAMDLAIEFDNMQGTDHERRLIYSHCMMLINRNPLLLGQLGIASNSGGDEPPSPTPAHGPQKRPSQHHA